jgi:hypothetical protein
MSYYDLKFICLFKSFKDQIPSFHPTAQSSIVSKIVKIKKIMVLFIEYQNLDQLIDAQSEETLNISISTITIIQLKFLGRIMLIFLRCN